MAMTVKDLIQKLKNLPEDSLVLVDGYEGGFCDVKTLKNIKVKLNVNTEDYNGPHDVAPGADIDAIVITRS